MNIYRNGDFCFRGIETLPKKLIKQKDKVVGWGEVTGHSHRFSVDAPVTLFLADDKKRYMEVLSPSIISHEEHHPLTILPGKYEIISEKEYSYEDHDARLVVD